jgi:hypothetical protein
LFRWDASTGKWSGPDAIGSGSTAGHPVFPSATAFDDGVAILYYDRREHPGSSQTDVYLTILPRVGGPRDIRVSDVASDWSAAAGDPEYAMIQRNMGDYITLTASGRTLFAVWTDARDGLSRIYGRTIDP